MGTPKWAKIPTKDNSPLPPSTHPTVPALTPLVNLLPGPLQQSILWNNTPFVRKRHLLESETQNTFYFFSICRFLRSSNHSSPCPFSPSSDASLGAIEHCFSVLCRFPGVPLIWKLSDSTQCQNSWGTIPVLVVPAFFYLLSFFFFF